MLSSGSCWLSSAAKQAKDSAASTRQRRQNERRREKTEKGKTDVVYGEEKIDPVTIEFFWGKVNWQIGSNSTSFSLQVPLKERPEETGSQAVETNQITDKFMAAIPEYLPWAKWEKLDQKSYTLPLQYASHYACCIMIWERERKRDFSALILNFLNHASAINIVELK